MSLVGGAAALAVALVLLAAGVGHLRDLPGLRRALAAHGVLGPGACRAVATVLAPVELVLAVALVVTVLLPVGALALVLAAVGAILLLGGFTGYLLVVLRRTRGRGEIPCGCGLGAAPVGPWAVLRAGLLTGLALVVLGSVLTGGGPGITSASAGAPVAAQWFVVLAAGLSLAIASAALPAARAVPAGLTTLHGGHR